MAIDWSGPRSDVVIEGYPFVERLWNAQVQVVDANTTVVRGQTENDEPRVITIRRAGPVILVTSKQRG